MVDQSVGGYGDLDRAGRRCVNALLSAPWSEAVLFGPLYSQTVCARH